MTTEELASKLGLQAHTLRSVLCRSGSYYGLKPKKLPNRRLLWPDDAFDQLVRGQPEKVAA